MGSPPPTRGRCWSRSWGRGGTQCRGGRRWCGHLLPFHYNQQIKLEIPNESIVNLDQLKHQVDLIKPLNIIKQDN